MNMFGQILDIVYTQKGERRRRRYLWVYSGGAISRYPEGQSILQIMFDTDPDTERLKHLNKIVLDELDIIAANGPRESDFSKVKSI